MTGVPTDRPRKILTGIAPVSWEHPADRAALQSLRAVPGFDTAVRKILAFIGGEQGIRLIFQANAVKVGPQQFPKLHVIFRLKIKLRNLTPYPLITVIRFIIAIRYRFMGDIRYSQTDLCQFSLYLAQFILSCFQCISKAGYFFQQGLNIFTCSLCLANGLGSGVAIILQRLSLHMQGLSFLLQ